MDTICQIYPIYPMIHTYERTLYRNKQKTIEEDKNSAIQTVILFSLKDCTRENEQLLNTTVSR